MKQWIPALLSKISMLSIQTLFEYAGNRSGHTKLTHSLRIALNSPELPSALYIC